MEYLIVFFLMIISNVILKQILGVKIKKIKQLVKQKEQGLEAIEEKLPENQKICRNILKKLNLKEVVIEEDENSDTSLYIALSNKILLGKIQNRYMAVQTIAHECIHAKQSKKLQISNFILSNLYLLYFIVILFLTLFQIIHTSFLQISILFLLYLLWYLVRSYLETDAMTKAPYLAKEYLQENQILQPEELEKLMQEYERVNRMGIPFIHFQLFFSGSLKIMIYCIVCFVFAIL